MAKRRVSQKMSFMSSLMTLMKSNRDKKRCTFSILRLSQLINYKN